MTDKYEVGTDTKLIANGTEFDVTNVEENPGQVDLSEASFNNRLEDYTAPARVSHEVTISVDGSARQLNRALYGPNWHPRENIRIQTRGSEDGTRYTQAKPTDRARSVPSDDGTSCEITIRADRARMTG